MRRVLIFIVILSIVILNPTTAKTAEDLFKMGTNF